MDFDDPKVYSDTSITLMVLFLFSPFVVRIFCNNIVQMSTSFLGDFFNQVWYAAGWGSLSIKCRAGLTFNFFLPFPPTTKWSTFFGPPSIVELRKVEKGVGGYFLLYPAPSRDRIQQCCHNQQNMISTTIFLLQFIISKFQFQDRYLY